METQSKLSLELAPDEVDVLRRVLTMFLGDLRMEIADTEAYELRQSLKADELAIKAIIAKIG